MGNTIAINKKWNEKGRPGEYSVQKRIGGCNIAANWRRRMVVGFRPFFSPRSRIKGPQLLRTPTMEDSLSRSNSTITGALKFVWRTSAYYHYPLPCWYLSFSSELRTRLPRQYLYSSNPDSLTLRANSLSYPLCSAQPCLEIRNHHFHSI